MGKFVFRLAKLKQVKTIYEEQAKLVWAEANRQLSNAINQLAVLREMRVSTSEYGYQCLDISLRPAFYQYLNKIDRMIDTQREIITNIKREEENKRDKWNQARKEKEILQHLEEKQYREYIYEQLKNEQKELDEIKNSSPRV